VVAWGGVVDVEAVGGGVRAGVGRCEGGRRGRIFSFCLDAGIGTWEGRVNGVWGVGSFWSRDGGGTGVFVEVGFWEVSCGGARWLRVGADWFGEDGEGYGVL
jgi:hypothetical protein